MDPYFNQILKEPKQCLYKTDKKAHTNNSNNTKDSHKGNHQDGALLPLSYPYLIRTDKDGTHLRTNPNFDIPAPNFSSFFDNTGLFFWLVKEVEWFIKRFETLGKPQSASN